jgi:hypothetical protein
MNVPTLRRMTKTVEMPRFNSFHSARAPQATEGIELHGPAPAPTLRTRCRTANGEPSDQGLKELVDKKHWRHDSRHDGVGEGQGSNCEVPLSP